MAKSVIPAFAGADGRPLSTIAEGAVSATSADLAWRGIMVEHYQHGPLEMPEMLLPNHHLTLQLSRALVIERKIEGRWRSQRTEQGSFTLTSAAVSLQARWTEPVEVLAIALDPRFVAGVMHDTDAAAHAFALQFAWQDPRITGIGMALLAEMTEGGPNGPLFAESLATALALHLVGRYLRQPWQPVLSSHGLPPRALRRVLDYMQAHLAETLTLATLASIAGSSPAHFALLFKRSTGSSPYRYVLALRVERAKTLLQHTQLPLGDIAVQSGFANQSHMTHHVSRLLGMTPLALRRSQ